MCSVQRLGSTVYVATVILTLSLPPLGSPGSSDGGE